MPSLRKKQILAPERQILAFPDHYVTVPGKVAPATITGLKKTDDSRKAVIERGTVVCIKADGSVVKPSTTDLPNGVIFNTEEVSAEILADEPVNVTVLVHGFVRKDRLVELTAGDAAKLPALIMVSDN